MVNWQDELKRHLIKKLSATLGVEIPMDKIHMIEMSSEDIPLEDFDIEGLANIYAFSIMKEDFETCEKISEEIKNRNCRIEIDVDDTKKTGIINVYLQPESALEKISINMKVLKDGMMIDFDKED